MSTPSKFHFWTEYRYALLRFLRDCSGTPEGACAPGWVTFIYYVLFPLNWAYEKQSGIKYEAPYDTYIIHGIRITGVVFEQFKGEVGSRFEVVKSQDGLVTIRRAAEIQLPIHEN